MADYAAVPLQPIAHALLTIDAAGNPQITGRGFSSVERASAFAGDFLLTMDEGTGVADIGSGSVVGQAGFGYATGIIGPNGLDPRFARVGVTMRGGTTAPGSTTIAQRMAEFVVTPGEGALQVRISLAGGAGFDTPTDPMGAGAANANGSGVEIMVWNGNAGPDNAQQQLVGPLFQGAMQFP
jgi:hypothetical protein